jgi:hypothetical protein
VKIPRSVPFPPPGSGATAGPHSRQYRSSEGVDQGRPGRGRGNAAGHSSQQQSEPAASSDGQIRVQWARGHSQLPGAADHLDWCDVDRIEAVGTGDKYGDLVTGGDEQPVSVRVLNHDIADRAEW